MLFEKTGIIYLAVRHDNKLARYRETNLKTGYSFTRNGSATDFGRVGFLPGLEFKPVSSVVFSNEGLRPFSFGWLGFSRFTDKVVMVVGANGENYDIVVLYSKAHYDVVGAQSILPQRTIEQAPNDFEFELTLPPTEDYLDYYARR